jgi:hypothetical protein
LQDPKLKFPTKSDLIGLDNRLNKFGGWLPEAELGLTLLFLACGGMKSESEWSSLEDLEGVVASESLMSTLKQIIGIVAVPSRICCIS